MNNNELRIFAKWVIGAHPEIYKEYTSKISLDVNDPTPWNLKFSEDQKKVLDQINIRLDNDTNNCSCTTWCNWKDAPVIGDDLYEYLKNCGANRMERIYLSCAVDDVDDMIPLFDEFDEGNYPDLVDNWKKLTVGQVNQILLWFRDEAHTSVTYDW